jgi:ATP-dependent protease ClpP protease subunit
MSAQKRQFKVDIDQPEVEDECDCQEDSMGPDLSNIANQWIGTGISLETRDIDIIGMIDQHSLAPYIRAFRYMSSISNAPITITINSFGGCVFSTFAFIDWINLAKAQGTRVITIANGAVMSGGLFIFLAGSDRFITENARIMLHTIYATGPTGTPAQSQINNKENEELQKLIVAHLVRSTKKSAKSWEKIIKYVDSYYGAEEAKRARIAHKILK